MEKKELIKIINSFIDFNIEDARFYINYEDEEQMKKLGKLLIYLHKEKMILCRELEETLAPKKEKIEGNKHYAKIEEDKSLEISIEQIDLFIEYLKIKGEFGTKEGKYIKSQVNENDRTPRISLDEYKENRNMIIINILEMQTEKFRRLSLAKSQYSMSGSNFDKAMAEAVLLDSKEMRENFLKGMDTFASKFTSDELELLINSFYIYNEKTKVLKRLK